MMKNRDADLRAEIRLSAESALGRVEMLSKNIYGYKYSMMRDLLSGSPEYRRPDGSSAGLFPEEWETVALEELVSRNGIVEGPSENTLSSAAVEEGIPVIDGASISTLRFDASACRLVPRDFMETDSISAAPCDIVMARRGPHAGSCAIMPVFFTGGLLAPECVKIVPDNSRCEPFYLNNVLHHYYHTGILDTLRVSADEKEISIMLLGKLPVKLPPLDLQKYIADTLLEISGKIAECDQLMEDLNKLKNYFS